MAVYTPTLSDCTCPDKWSEADVAVCPFHAPVRLVTEDEFSTALFTSDSPHNTTAYWYAWGRLDQGHAPLANRRIYSTRGTPDNVTTAWWFAYLYTEHRNAEAESVVTYGLPSCWDHFVASQGRQITPIR